MPMYDYQCKKCKLNEERFVPMAEREDQRCECSGKMKQILTPTYIHNANTGGRNG